MRRFFLLAAVLYMGFIFYLSSFPGSDATSEHWLFRLVEMLPGGDKSAHLAEYAILGFLLQLGLNHPIGAFVISVLFGISDEFHQSVVPLRDAGVSDLIADAIGAFVGILTARWLEVRLRLWSGLQRARPESHLAATSKGSHPTSEDISS